MSEVRLNIIDWEGAVHGTVHGSVSDAVVAALSAEPQTLIEVEAAMARFIRPTEQRPFLSFKAGVNDEPWDAGVVLVDLAARVLASESLYSQPEKEGEVAYHDGTKATDVAVLYRVPDDWVFLNSLAEYKAVRARRRTELAANPPLDARLLLYENALLDFIVGECLSAQSRASGDQEFTEEEIASLISGIHAKWLITPREELNGESPRDVLLARREHIDFDLHTRQLQWTFVGEGPPCLSRDSFAYRFAGFGTQECVVYYDLVRHLLWECWERIPNSGKVKKTEGAAAQETAQLKSCLQDLKEEWLEQPQKDFSGRVPALIIENERRRLPSTMSSKDVVIDEDCDICQMMGDDIRMGLGVSFWGLDGCNMDDDFAFSFFRTREEWEADKQRWKEFNREFDRKWKEEHPEDLVDENFESLGFEGNDLIQ